MFDVLHLPPNILHLLANVCQVTFNLLEPYVNNIKSRIDDFELRVNLVLRCFFLPAGAFTIELRQRLLQLIELLTRFAMLAFRGQSFVVR